MKISSLAALLTVLGCFSMSAGEKRNRCNDAPPKFDSKKISPGMYVIDGVGGDTTTLPLRVELYHANGVLYVRNADKYPDGTPIASESWHNYSDSGNQLKWGGDGESRGTSVSGQWSQTWVPYGTGPLFYKDRVTSNSFRKVNKVEIRDEDGGLIDCEWGSSTYMRIGSDQAPWPSAVNWPEVWPDSVARQWGVK